MQFPANKRSKGFALLITITLLAFLVLLLVSLASLTRVETQVASNNQQLAQARQNALMALNIAVGQLQKYAGPDQRITARSDMDGSLAKTTSKSGRWLGVYGNGAVADYSQPPDTVSANIVTAATPSAVGSQAKLLNWLVSGNEATAFDSTPGGANVGTSGQIATPPSTFAYSPTDTITNLSSSSTALDKNLKIKTNQDARLLVGPNTVGVSPEDYVAAPLQDINATLEWIGGNQRIGRYAWWVGDESTKARVNLPLAIDTQKPYAFVSSQRPAIELVDAKTPSASTPDITSTSNNTTLVGNMLDPSGSLSLYNPDDASNPITAKFPRLLSANQFPMLGTDAAKANALRTAIQYRYHDLTGSSVSVLADAYAGGLKKDLSAVLRKQLIGNVTPAGQRLGVGLNTDDTDFIFPPQTNISTGSNPTSYPYNEFGLPTWGQLRSFATTTSPTSGTAALVSEPPKMGMPVAPYNASPFNNYPVSTSVGIGPVATYMTIGFKYIADDSTIGNPIQLVAIPIVVLWNPYTSKISGTNSSGSAQQYELGFRKAYSGKVQLQGRESGTPATWSSANILETVDFEKANPDPYYRLIIELPSGGIQPGQSLVFTLKNDKQMYDGKNVMTNVYNPYNYTILRSVSQIGVKLPSNPGSAVPLLPQGIYRVAVNSSPTPGAGHENDPRINGSGPSAIIIPATMWNQGTSPNWSGINGTHQGYLGTVTAGSNYPSGSLPYRGSSSQQFYQFFNLGTPSTTTPPYGNANANTGYAISGAVTDYGLVQPEARLVNNVSSPPWRIVMWTPFNGAANSGNRSRWAFGNPRAMIIGGSGPNSISWPPNLNTTADGLEASAGTSLSDGSGQKATLYEFRPDNLPLLSIGQLKHANLGWLAGGYLVGTSNGFGGNVNTNANARVTSVASERISAPIQRWGGPTLTSTWSAAGLDPASRMSWSYDHAYLINRALWDRHFVSTIPYEGTGKSGDTNNSIIDQTAPLPNPNHIFYNNPSNTNLRNVNSAAASLLLAGGFNVNSTSEQAWRAILGGSNQLKYDPVTESTTSGWAKIIYSRFSKPSTNSTSNAWDGYKQLTEPQIAALAANIVVEIRNRGPFISLADFINRRIYRPDVFPLDVTINGPDTYDPRLKGTIQGAIDRMSGTANAINTITAPFTTSGPDNRVIGSFQNFANASTYPDNPYTSSSTNPRNPPAPYGTTAAGAPQFLTQADVLTAIGSQLTARSDTFVIRTYGEVLDPVNSTASAPVVLGQAWCEAVVQRLPDYVDQTDPLIIDSGTGLPNNATAPAAAGALNQKFGRKLKVISFRWLTAQDI